MIVGSLAGALSAGGGFCVGSSEVIDHQRISATSYTFSCALPAMLASTAIETLDMLQSNPGLLTACRANIAVMRAQLIRSDWVACTSSAQNPVQLLVLKSNITSSRGLSFEQQEQVIQDCVDEALANGVLISRLKRLSPSVNSTPNQQGWQQQPALKVCITTGLSKGETEKAGVVIRHAITKVLTKKARSKLSLPSGI